jgi:pyruvate dehydrogenase E2 component (dihydrolipoamide acetyltransferase)
MITNIILPKLGETMEEATITNWLKNEGDRIKKGEPLLEITTDKATFEVESPADGMVRKILVKNNDVVPVAQVIAFIGEPSDLLPNISATSETVKPESVEEKSDKIEKQVPLTELPECRVFASPRAKSLAKDKGIDISKVKGTGPEGRIIEKDVLNFSSTKPEIRATPVAEELIRQMNLDKHSIKGTGEGGKITKEDVLSYKIPSAVSAIPAMRRVIAEKMIQSKTAIPHFYATIAVDMTHLINFRNLLKSKNIDVGFNDFLIKASSIALKNIPQIRTVWTGQGLELKQDINIGLAVAMEDGLMVPVIKDADKKTLLQICSESRALIEKVRNKKILPHEYAGGILTISNLGMFGIESFSAIIQPGESSILAIGAITKEPVALENVCIIRDIMRITLSADHRVVDGAVGAKFLSSLKQMLEFPGMLLL